MKPDIKQKWIAALRSGEYTQNRYKTYKVTEGKCSFCGLGVLMDIYLKEHNLEWTSKTVYGSMFCSHTYLPSVIYEWSKLDYGMQIRMTNLNDIKKYTFEQLADYIENLKTI